MGCVVILYYGLLAYTLELNGPHRPGPSKKNWKAAEDPQGSPWFSAENCLLHYSQGKNWHCWKILVIQPSSKSQKKVPPCLSAGFPLQSKTKCVVNVQWKVPTADAKKATAALGRFQKGRLLTFDWQFDLISVKHTTWRQCASQNTLQTRLQHSG